jgi:hypothetical protein
MTSLKPMKNIFFCFLILAPQWVWAQPKKINIGIQLNPILHCNQANTSPENLGYMEPFNIGGQIGMEVNYHMDDRFSLVPVFKYYYKSQKIIQNEFYGYFTQDSKTFMKYSYETFAIGLLAKYNIYHSLTCVAGFIYAYGNVSKINYGYHLVSGDLQDLSSMGYMFTPNDLGTKINMFQPVLGIRNSGKINRIGVFEYGFLVYFPTKKMPQYTYDQILVTKDNGEIHSNSTYDSKQYSAEISIIYYLLNFNNKYRIYHPKRSQPFSGRQ